MATSLKTFLIYTLAAIAVAATGAGGVYVVAHLAPDALPSGSKLISFGTRDKGWWEGVVVRVIDGDTAILALTDGRRVKIHLDDIEAPALNTEYGEESRRLLASLINQTYVIFRQTARKRDGGYVGVLQFSRRQGPSVNEQMVALGAARASAGRGVNKRISILSGEAEDRRRGIWASNNRSEDEDRQNVVLPFPR